MTVTNALVGGRGRPRSDSTYGEITQSFLVLSHVKLLLLGCRSSACGLRRVPVLLVFYSSFGSQNTLQCKSQCTKMPPIMSKLKEKKHFQWEKTCSDRFFAVLLTIALSIFVPLLLWRSSSSELFWVHLVLRSSGLGKVEWRALSNTIMHLRFP
jgi:hypothetical protein